MTGVRHMLSWVPRGLALVVFCCVFVSAAAKERVIAIGDIHGDYANFLDVLKATNLINDEGVWIGGKATLVQLGDIPDRGPDTRKIIDYLRDLKQQAGKSKGKVELLIGNHEIMNVIGDLRFVHPGEYAAFKDSKSEPRLDRYYKKTVAALTAAADDDLFELPPNHRAQWDEQFPLGYVAHRLAWSPKGEYGRWVSLNSAVLKVGSTLFVHGGIAPEYAKRSVRNINRQVKRELSNPQKLKDDAIILDGNGPFWYRGWAKLPETQENEQALQQVLDHFEVQRMVVAHTPVLNTVLPRFAGKVILVDAGLSDHYFGSNAALELIDGQPFAVVKGERIALPSTQQGVIDYLSWVIERVKEPQLIEQYRSELMQSIESKQTQTPATQEQG